MKTVSIASVFALLVLSAALLLLCAGTAYGLPQAQPSTVFVFNGNTDGFNNNAQGYIWQQMGLLDANGRPATRQGNNLVDSGGNVVGSVILSGTQVIGYRNAAGTMECYDVSAGATTAQAWGRVANNGELHIIKHGASYEEPPGTPHEGGGHSAR